MIDCHTHYNKYTKNEKWIATSNIKQWSDNITTVYGLGHLPFSLFNSYRTLEQLLAKNSNYYLGEWGLDKRSSINIEIQEEILNKIVDIARKYNRMVVLHNVGYVDRIIKLIHNNKDVCFLWHGYRYDSSVASSATKFNNCVLGIGPHFFKSKYDLQNLLSYPILPETDWDNNGDYSKLYADIKLKFKGLTIREKDARKILKT